MDFYKISAIKDKRIKKEDVFNISPTFDYTSEDDLICKGGELYAYWYNNQWNTNVKELIRIIDGEIFKTRDRILTDYPEATVNVNLMRQHKSNIMKEFATFTKLFTQSDAQFNTRIIFSNETPKREDYSTNKLDYTPSPGSTEAFDELFNHLYNPEELEKILWFIGALLTNNMCNIQKFMYLYGAKGTGKGTVIKLIEKLFKGYYGYISLARLTSGSEFATAQIKELPLLIDTDSKISKIKDDTNLLKLTGHETLSVNIKHKQLYDVTFRGLLVTASNQRYQVANIDSGITRRAVVVHPSNRRLSPTDYFNLVARLDFELPHIAQKAIDLFNELGPYYYEDYIDIDMAEATDHIFSFVREYWQQLGDPCSLKKAAELYKLYLEDIGYETRGYKKKIKEELGRYYNEFHDKLRIGEETVSNMFRGFKYNAVFPNKEIVREELEKDNKIKELEEKLGLRVQKSVLDEIMKDYPAQLTNDRGYPLYKWDNVGTTVGDLDTKLLHYVRLPLNHIVIDLDIKDEDGNKSLIKNLTYALKFPPTYTEISKGGSGIHLHYIYDGDVTLLEKLYDEDVEIKIFTGKAALRRRLSKCNNLPIAHLTSGLPTKEKGGKMYSDVSVIVWDEKKLRKLISNGIKRVYHKNTAPSVSLIVKAIKEAEEQGIKYDIRDMRQDLVIFATNSSNQKENCLKMLQTIKYSTIDEEVQSHIQTRASNVPIPKEELYFYDVEVFPNLLVVVYKKYGDNPKEYLINPSSEQIEAFLKKPLVGFNNRRYDNHILYARLIGGSLLDVYRASQNIINKEKAAFYGGAYELSYVDIYEYSSKKQSLKKWEVELGLFHDELDLPWDQPVPEELWSRIAEYCGNDVDATEAVFDATAEDYMARLILAQLSGLSINSKTQDHAKEFVFNHDRDPVKSLVYTDLSEMFKGYKFEWGKSTYKGLDINEGGRVVSKPGIYHNVGLFDVKSMHPHSFIALGYFGKYTERVSELVEARVAVKEHRFDDAAKMLNGVLKPHLNEEHADALAYALKIVINIIYGMTSAKYPNPFKHPDNVDNIVAKRGSLFMVDLQEAVEAQGYNVIHIKTDSIKVENVDDKIAEFIFDFAKKYQYEFEWEATYDTIALVDDANYIAKGVRSKPGEPIKKDWSVTGAIFADPYVFKTLFSKEEIDDRDYRVVKEVSGASIYLDEKFIGRIAELYASLTGHVATRRKDDKSGALNNTKGFLWKQYSEFKNKEDLDMAYYHAEVVKAYKKLEAVGDPSLVTDFKID